MAYWIWNWGDWEIFHVTSANLRREERGKHYPAMWNLPLPYPTANFKKELDAPHGGYLICYMNGDGMLNVDDCLCPKDTKITLSPGKHWIEIYVSNPGKLPAVYIESDVCPSDETWLCYHSRVFGDSEAFKPVGFRPFYDSVEKNPEVFPFSYETKYTASQTKTEDGILYDFGTELFGYLDISGADKDTKLNIYYGESDAEALDKDNCYLTDEVCGSTSYRLQQRAFRYVLITPAVDTLTVTAEYEHLPIERQSAFSCDNELFCEIFEKSAYTFHLNCREGFFDGIKRDRWVWVADSFISARISRYLFFDKDIEQRSLLGLLGKQPFCEHLNTILDYTPIWFIMLYEHFMAYGDKVFLTRIMPEAEKLFEFLESRLNSDGFLEGIDSDWTFLDWADIDKTGAVCAEQMLMIQAYRAMAEIKKYLGESADVYEEKYETLKARVNQYFWNEEKGAFIDSFRSGKNQVTRHANIFAVMFDIATDRQTESIVRNVLQNDAIPQIVTPYFKSYESDVLAKTGHLSEVENSIASYWGDMIALGASTFWEEYNPALSGIQHYAMYGRKFEKSLCHAWGAGPIYLLGRYYLGVYPTAPGFETFRVEPTPGTFKTMQGTVPIVDGSVTVSFDEQSLTVLATKSGGTLVWNGKAYTLTENEALSVLRNEA